MRCEPKLNQRVRVLFEENLDILVFPKVKEFVFRVAKHSPLEVVAKVLATKNMHADKWQDYCFAHVSKRECKETRYDDLSTTFEELADAERLDALEEVTLFYSVRNLQ